MTAYKCIVGNYTVSPVCKIRKKNCLYGYMINYSKSVIGCLKLLFSLGCRDAAAASWVLAQTGQTVITTSQIAFVDVWYVIRNGQVRLTGGFKSFTVIESR